LGKLSGITKENQAKAGHARGAGAHLFNETRRVLLNTENDVEALRKMGEGRPKNAITDQKGAGVSGVLTRRRAKRGEMRRGGPEGRGKIKGEVELNLGPSL